MGDTGKRKEAERDAGVKQGKEAVEEIGTLSFVITF